MAKRRASLTDEADPSFDLEPMEARLVDSPSEDAGWQFEPKWDGFRCLAFRSGREVELRAKSGKTLTKRLERLIKPPGFTGDAPGAPSRWSTERSTEWEPLRPKLVVEVRYDHITGDRFRHGTKLIRWRPDKSPKQCTFEQLQPPARPGKVIDKVVHASKS